MVSTKNKIVILQLSKQTLSSPRERQRNRENRVPSRDRVAGRIPSLCSLEAITDGR